MAGVSDKASLQKQVAGFAVFAFISRLRPRECDKRLRGLPSFRETSVAPMPPLSSVSTSSDLAIAVGARPLMRLRRS